MKTSTESRRIASPKKLFLYKRIEDKIRQMVEAFPVGALFPSERDLSVSLKISRKTLRQALKPLVEQGVLEQGAGRGTVVRKHQDGGFDNIHPFSAGAFANFPLSQPLRICLYEDYPLQKRFWSAISDLFACEHGGARVEFDFLSHEISTAEAYLSHIKKINPDLIQLSGSSWHNALHRELAAPIPQDLAASKTSDEFHIRSLFSCAADEDVGNFAVLSFALPCVIWNSRDFGGRSLEGLLDGRASCAAYLKSLPDIVRALPAGMKLAGHLADSVGHGIVLHPEELTEAALRMFLHSMFERISSLPPDCPGWFASPITSNYYIFNSMRLLKERKTFMSCALLMYADSISSESNGDFQAVVPELWPQGYQGVFETECSGFIVNSSCGNKEGAWDFVRFCLSEQAQRMIPDMIHNCAVMSRCNERLAPFVANSPESLKRLLSRIKSATTATFRFGAEIARIRRQLYPGLLSGAVGVDDAVEQALIGMGEAIRRGGVGGKGYQ